MRANNTVPVGTRVMYHGSLTDYHGPMIVEGTHAEWADTQGKYSSIRYILSYGSGDLDFLHNVRPESFTVILESSDE